MARQRRYVLAWLVVVGMTLPGVARAQQTRTGQLEEQRAQRAREGPPPPTTALEKGLQFLQSSRLLEPGRPARSLFYPKVGTVTTGGGLGFGGGYRLAFANDNAIFDVNGILTMRGYRVVRAGLSLPRLLEHKFEINTFAQYRYFSQEDFYGVGPDSRKADRTDFLVEETGLTTQVAYRPTSWLALASQTAWLNPRVGRGTDRHQPSIETLFTDAVAPGLAQQTRFLEQGGLVEVDYRDSDSRARSGGRYAVYAARYDDVRNRGFDFSRVASQLEQYFPVFDSKRVVVLRLTMDHRAAAPGSRVPFYYMRPFGGKDTLRGVNDLRFRDANAWIGTAEYRWEAVSGVDLALFYDRQGVAPRFKALSLRNAKDTYGVGVRAGTDSAIFLRAEMAFGGDEGGRYYVAFSAPLKIERWLR